MLFTTISSLRHDIRASLTLTLRLCAKGPGVHDCISEVTCRSCCWKPRKAQNSHLLRSACPPQGHAGPSMPSANRYRPQQTPQRHSARWTQDYHPNSCFILRCSRRREARALLLQLRHLWVAATIGPAARTQGLSRREVSSVTAGGNPASEHRDTRTVFPQAASRPTACLPGPLLKTCTVLIRPENLAQVRACKEEGTTDSQTDRQTTRQTRIKAPQMF